ncbi:MAG: lactonase family protein [Gemmatimonadota bacterium]|nr:lactonase family protein [Gemmatimonadota bacterium]MDH3424667.1 lactonase family protein [Gemmatimonadota bacterium]
MRHCKRTLLILTVTATAGCYDQVIVPDFETDGRIAITNDEATLDARVSYPHENVPIAPTPMAAGGMAMAPARAPSSIDLTLLAEVLPPTVGPSVVQATSVWATSDNKAVVSYNQVGAVALGALDYFIQLGNKTPKLKSSLTFLDSDVNSVFTDGTSVFSAVATSDLAFATPAVLEKVTLSGSNFSLAGNVRVDIESFAATSTMSTGSYVYATSGDGGGVYAFDAGSLALVGQYPLDDARWVAWDQPNGRIVVLQGTPGRLAVFEEGSFPGGSMTLLNTWLVTGVDVPESKSTVQVAGSKAFVAAGPDGVQVVCLDDGQTVGSVPRPDPGSLGLPSSVVVTNAVTVQGDLMFISNGEAGVYAAAAPQSFETSACTAPQSISTLGRLQFGNLQSANHVVYRNDMLFVAAGLGGLKVVEVDLN